MSQAEKELLLAGDGQNETLKPRKEAIQKIIRHSFRVPWGDDDDGYVILQGKRYELINIGSHGIGMLCGADEFMRGQLLAGINLHLGGTSLKLNGEVIHVSPETEEDFLCGIRLNNISKLDEKNIREALEKKCKEMFPQTN